MTGRPGGGGTAAPRLFFAAAMHNRRGHDRRAPVTARIRPALAAGAIGFAAATLAAACGTTGPTGTPPAFPSAPGPSGVPSSAATQPPTETAPPTASPLPPSVLAPCTAADLKASHGRVEGAAGSQFTEVVLVSAIACSMDRYPSLGLRDAKGAPLVGVTPGGIGRLDLVAGAAYVSVVRLANWCRDVEPAFPLALEIRIGAEAVPVTGDPFPAEGETPPCTGEGLPPTLEGGAWGGAE